MTHSNSDDAGVPYHSRNTYIILGHSMRNAIPFSCCLHGFPGDLSEQGQINIRLERNS